jgi:toxin ParE1/3/4
MKTIVFAPAVAADIDEIYDYTEENWGYQQPKIIRST